MKITQQQRLMMIGAMTLCKNHYDKMRELEQLICGFVGKDNEDWVSDEIYGTESFDFDTVVSKSGIEVDKDV